MASQTTTFDYTSRLYDTYMTDGSKGTTFGQSTVVEHGRISRRGSRKFHAWWMCDDLFSSPAGGTSLGATATITDAYFEVTLAAVTNDISAELGGFDGKVWNLPQGCTDAGFAPINSNMEDTVTWCSNNGNICTYNVIVGVCNVIGGLGPCVDGCINWDGGKGSTLGSPSTWTYDSTLSVGATMHIPCTECVQYSIDSATAPGLFHVFAEDGQVADTQFYRWHSLQSGTTASRPKLVINWDDGAPPPPSPITSTNNEIVFSHNADLISLVSVDATAGMVIGASAELKATAEISSAASMVFSADANLVSKKDISAEASLVLTTSSDIIATTSLSSSAPVVLSSSAELSATNNISSDANLVLSSSGDISTTASISGGISLPGFVFSTSAAQSAIGSISSSAPIVLTISAAQSAIGSISSSAPIVLTTSAELTATTSIAGNSLDMVLTTDANISATASIYGGVSLPGFVFTSSAAQSAIGSISSSAPMVFGATAELSYAASLVNISATAGMTISSNAPELINATPITELAGGITMGFSTSLADVISLLDPYSVDLVLSLDNANLRDTTTIKAAVATADMVLFAGKGQGGTGPALRDAFRWLTDSTEPTAGVELCPYTPFTLRTKFDTLLGGITFGDKYEDLEAAGLTVGWQTGVISGIPTELDTYVGLFAIPEGQIIDEESYATYGSAGLFDATGNSVAHGITFIGQATLHDPIVAPDATYLAIELPLTIEREFFVPIYNNWSSDRDQLALTLNTPHHHTYFGGKQVSPHDFLAAEKAQGYYGNVCVPVTMPKSVVKAIAINTDGDLTDPSAHAASINRLVMSTSATIQDGNPVDTL